MRKDMQLMPFLCQLQEQRLKIPFSTAVKGKLFFDEREAHCYMPPCISRALAYFRNDCMA